MKFTMEKNIKIVLSIIIIVTIILVIGASVLYFTTDLLKPNEILFQKYFSQNFSNLSYIMNFQDENQLIDYVRKNNYITETQAKLSYIEKQNDQEEIYNITEKGIINNTENASYRVISVNYGAENIINLELLDRDSTIGLKLNEISKAFICVENSSISNFLSKLGLNGSTFQEKINLKDIEISDIFSFSENELAQMKKIYSKAIFQDIDKNSYSKKKNVIITLNNNKSFTTNRYTITLSKTELDKVYKRVLNQALEDEIILSKLEKIDNTIKESGINENEGISVKELYESILKNLIDSFEYSGQNEKMISFNVFETNGTIVRTSVKENDDEYIIDYDYSDGITASFENIRNTNEGQDKNIFSIGKNIDNSRSYGYYDKNNTLKINLGIDDQEQKIDLKGNIEYSSDNIDKLNLEVKSYLDFSNKKDIDTKFNNTNSLILNNKDDEEIKNILEKLRDLELKNLEKKQAKINTKLLKNILNWADDKRNNREIEEINKQNEEKTKFNNKFNLFEGEKINYESVQKLLESIENNFKDVKVINGKHIKLMIEQGAKNEEQFKKLNEAFSNRYLYNIKMEYDQNGYINAIDISIYENS